jgi:DNA-binding transcriptional LysR family regulator
MNTQQLRYLVAAADVGSISGAARANQVSQPVVSRALHGLESEYGVRLFRRSGRCLVLTDDGDAVVAVARRALDALDDVEHTARRLATTSELAIVATPTNSALLSPIVTEFVRHHPEIALRLRRASDMDEVLRLVAAGEADLGFGDLDDRWDESSIRIEAIWQTHVVVVSPLGSTLPSEVSLAGLADSLLVLPPHGSGRRQMIDEMMVSAGASAPTPALSTDERSAWLTSAQKGIGSFLCYEAVAADFDRVELRALDPPAWATVGFIRGSNGLSEEGEEMLRLARECPMPPGCRPV